MSNKGRKIGKERISVLLCANTDGSHQLTPITVDKSHRQGVLKDCRNQLPAIYYNKKKEQFTHDIFHNSFFEHFAPEIKR
jgi:hypothetical protein